MRFTLSRIVTAVCFIVSFFLLWSVLKQGRNNLLAYTCYNSVSFQDQLHKLSSRVHHVLSTMGLTHFLCYGALWGQIHSSRILPWKTNIEFCLLNEEVSKRDEVLFVRIFKKHHLVITYDSSEGLYNVRNPRFEGGKVKLILFEENNLAGMMRRVGWKRRVLPPNCEITSLECFPSRLVSPPLPGKEFGGYILPVPKEGIEIQKYHYPNDWWKDIIHRNCSEKDI